MDENNEPPEPVGRRWAGSSDWWTRSPTAVAHLLRRGLYLDARRDVAAASAPHRTPDSHEDGRSPAQMWPALAPVPCWLFALLVAWNVLLTLGVRGQLPALAAIRGGARAMSRRRAPSTLTRRIEASRAATVRCGASSPSAARPDGPNRHASICSSPRPRVPPPTASPSVAAARLDRARRAARGRANRARSATAWLAASSRCGGWRQRRTALPSPPIRCS